ncbi:HAD family hydrolase [Pedobacter sp. B4-66]|uniref:HAD family hydrolase n=1 Tax=Pedobacter sp. B4-66 TaxID=2817280 RepID=UPI001BDA5DDC|nr:HAD family hydrolase [Pedobacter sp. B4-66]
MNIENYDFILFDAANTLIHKPDLWDRILQVLSNNNITVDQMELRRKHKVLSEIIHFPDRTSSEFYKTFNYEVLISLGIVANDKVLDEIFKACSYLPWRAFEDTESLKNLKINKAILSNFNSSLQDLIETIFGKTVFDVIIGSEVEKVSKPDIQFYKRAIEILNVEPNRILYIGDSLKLDVIPAQSLGIDAWLIDRDQNFTHFDKRISSLKELKS